MYPAGSLPGEVPGGRAHGRDHSVASERAPAQRRELSARAQPELRPQTAFQLGHDETVLNNWYKELVGPEEAKEYFEIFPNHLQSR